jgi:hypothetical protein
MDLSCVFKHQCFIGFLDFRNFKITKYTEIHYFYMYFKTWSKISKLKKSKMIYKSKKQFKVFLGMNTKNPLNLKEIFS